jgi:hypothetical protein
MKDTNKKFALMIGGLVLGLGSAVAPLRAQEAEQAAPAAVVSALPEGPNGVSASPDGAVNPLNESGATGSATAAGREACWKQAGISKSVAEQRKSIVSGARAQIRSVESDATLTLPEQKQQIRKIRMNARQDAAKLITPEQQEALRQCHNERAGQRTPAPSAAPEAPDTPPASTQPQ